MFTLGDENQLLPTLQMKYETRAKHNIAVPVKELEVQAFCPYERVHFMQRGTVGGVITLKKGFSLA